MTARKHGGPRPVIRPDDARRAPRRVDPAPRPDNPGGWLPQTPGWRIIAPHPGQDEQAARMH